MEQLVGVAHHSPAQRLAVLELHEVLHYPERDVVGGAGFGVAHGPSSGTKTRSVMCPARSVFQRGTTRIPVRIRSIDPASTTWRSPVWAPSRRTSANANGWSRGCLRPGWLTQAQVSTVPPGPTSTRAVSKASPVAGAHSRGGTSNPPSPGRAAAIVAVPRPGTERPITGPRVLVYGNAN